MAVGVARRRLGRPVKWVETRSENMVVDAHGRGQVQYVELGLTPRRHASSGLRVPDASATRAPTPASAARSPLGPTRMMAAGRVRHPEDRLRRRGRGHQHHADGRVPRRRPARGGRAARADHRPRRRRARASIPVELRRRNFIAARRVPVHDASPARTYDSGDYDAAARRGAAAGRLRRAARRAGGAVASAATRVQLGIGVASTSRSPAGGSGERVRRGRGARRRHRDGHGRAPRRTARATPRRSR